VAVLAKTLGPGPRAPSGGYKKYSVTKLGAGQKVRGPRLPGAGLELPLIKFARWQHPAVRNRARFAVLVTNYYFFI